MLTAISEHLFTYIASLLDGESLARLRTASKANGSLKAASTIRYIVSMRSRLISQELTTLEQISLAESLASCETEIRFRYQEVDLELCALDPLSKLAAILKKHKSIQVKIEGHCGLEAPRAMGFAFTRARANAVRDALISFGIEESRLHVRGFSNLKPLVWAMGEPAGSKNRRVEIFLQFGQDGLEIPVRRPESDYATRPVNFSTPFLDGDDDFFVQLEDQDDESNDDDEDFEDLDDEVLSAGFQELIRLGVAPRNYLTRILVAAHSAAQQSAAESELLEEANTSINNNTNHDDDGLI
mmetsp:Transcript_20001/g.25879  ORF Transcript_20001/g.25879 Transcript_20001/m.25879 type:complete len:298 (-) Transcript_20001:1892-2785(-)|eukprot:CAMPEP_0197327992 /NCGR_PEP_ID=MMETSP0892-20130614/3750_1 /TAXON_ID=44058 ORGANISM="Aureoumbra lagunensis, Strain CCMP1510" /NCGR_SAMPLE_ID=MMETSP0892 /ASSEMBLY_ACC=CAM_ASM_000538 /LENGTH=297 /DNA_ID=CAMNT_0042823357 /DNA_START=118 /DNA_END=1011 /DNA_ORIENTATION=-